MTDKIYNHIRKIKIEDYNYNLPDERIAKYPLSERDSSKLLFYNKGIITQNIFSDVSALVPEKSLLILNNTKVIRARMVFRKSSGARIEIFCLEPFEPSDFILNFQQSHSCKWKCIIGNNKKWKSGTLESQIVFNNQIVTITASKESDCQSYQIIQFQWDNNSFTFSDILLHLGETPIPPYLNRNSEDIDNERYQTVFSIQEGSVAAPTAGLHFTNEILDSLKIKGIDTENITLHVGAGTFKPVKSECIADHEMHTEHFFISRTCLQKIIDAPDRVFAVGTTSLRTLESMYWLGVNLLCGKTDFHVSQWQPYQQQILISANDSLRALWQYMINKNMETLTGSTNLMIVPGYEFKIVKGIITNFHQPKSTLLLLIAALIGPDWKKVYEFALNHQYRFLSYGDSSLLIS